MKALCRQLSILPLSFALLLLGSYSHAALPDFTQLARDMSKTVVSVSAFHNTTRGQGVSYGSGFVYSSEGYIITNHHVTNGAQSLLVRFNDRLELPAVQVGADKRTDIALLKVDPEKVNLHPVTIGDSENLQVGQWAAAIGSPFGFDYTLTAGVVSALGRSLPGDSYVPYIQSDVAVNEGNSGGPLFDLQGRVIGINTKIFSGTGGFAGLSFSIPIHVAVYVVEQIREKGVVVRGWLGVSIANVPRDLVEPFGLDRATGALVVEVFEDSPAAAAGIRDGDIITSFDGNAIIFSGDLPVYVGLSQAGDTYKVELIREGDPNSVRVKLGEKTSEQVIIGAANKDTSTLGMVLVNLPADVAGEIGLDGGAMVQSVVTGSQAEKDGIVPGDIITHFYQTRVRSVQDFQIQLRRYRSGATVPLRLIRQQRSPLFVAFTIP